VLGYGRCAQPKRENRAAPASDPTPPGDRSQREDNFAKHFSGDVGACGPYEFSSPARTAPAPIERCPLMTTDLSDLVTAPPYVCARGRGFWPPSQPFLEVGVFAAHPTRRWPPPPAPSPTCGEGFVPPTGPKRSLE
jgi:hypothetical protein